MKENPKKEVQPPPLPPFKDGTWDLSKLKAGKRAKTEGDYQKTLAEALGPTQQETSRSFSASKSPDENGDSGQYIRHVEKKAPRKVRRRAKPEKKSIEAGSDVTGQKTENQAADERLSQQRDRLQKALDDRAALKKEAEELERLLTQAEKRVRE